MSQRTKGHYPFRYNSIVTNLLTIRRSHTILNHGLSSFFSRSHQDLKCQVWKNSVLNEGPVRVMFHVKTKVSTYLNTFYLCICKPLFVAQIKVPRGTFFFATNRDFRSNYDK